MNICVADDGAYCTGDSVADLCQSWVDVCRVFRALFELLSVNYSVVTERDRAHSIITELMSDSGFSGRFPDGVLINLDAAPYVDVIAQITRALDFTTRVEEKTGKEDGYVDDHSTWEFDDALNSYYKAFKELNRLLFSRAGFIDRKGFEKRHSLVWV